MKRCVRFVVRSRILDEENNRLTLTSQTTSRFYEHLFEQKLDVAYIVLNDNSKQYV